MLLTSVFNFLFFPLYISKNKSVLTDTLEGRIMEETAKAIGTSTSFSFFRGKPIRLRLSQYSTVVQLALFEVVVVYTLRNEKH